MGQTLSEPVVEKHTTSGGDERFLYGASAMQGWRISMEDAHTTLLKLGPGGESAFFAVYDGHGGQTAAKFAGVKLHEYIVRADEYAKGNFEEAIKSGFLTADKDLRETPEMASNTAGCTSVCVLITKDGQVICGNAGDSRAIMSTAGRAVPLSHDHKPTDEVEFNRIVGAGGFVEFGRVNGNLALSRALGDFEFKNNGTMPAEKQIVTAFPDVIKADPSADNEFIVVACDGIWDCMTNEQVVQFVHAKITEGKKLDQICEDIMNRCLASESELGGVGCDNMTIVIVAILNGKSEDEWYESVKVIAEESGQKSSPKIERPGIDADDEDSKAIIKAIISHATQHPDSDDSDDSDEGDRAASAPIKLIEDDDADAVAAADTIAAGTLVADAAAAAAAAHSEASADADADAVAAAAKPGN
ncbi:Protein phosphatase 2C 2 [Coemansia biformis]|uniref:protein-serine/threonine phosphatase n=1 Tax=Coemansia biformis TaxID=1286918 RepID=A0A9W7YHK6_9FUNG|nr:Protein phosphatase 2C 2 [Coemansia biformis]